MVDPLVILALYSLALVLDDFSSPAVIQGHRFPKIHTTFIGATVFITYLILLHNKLKFLLQSFVFKVPFQSALCSSFLICCMFFSLSL